MALSLLCFVKNAQLWTSFQVFDVTVECANSAGTFGCGQRLNASGVGTTADAPHPLLVLDTSYVFRRTFDAACRLAQFEPTITCESRTPHTLLAMAESGHGVAIIPSTMRTDRHPLRIVAVTYRGKPLREPLALYWDKRRPLPRYAMAFSEMLAQYMREVFPISRPTKDRRARRQA